MEIEIVWGSGEGPTQLAAFDAALANAGIHNYNLVTLSSVIPPGATLVERGTHERAWDVGEMVATVLATNESSDPGESIAAGLGWTRSDRGGIFFETNARTAEDVEERIQIGMRAAKAHRPQWQWNTDIETRNVEHTVVENGAVVVAAVYRPL